MSNRVTTAQILKAIGNPCINLYRGDGYHYFTYDAPGQYDSHSVYVTRLNELSIEAWVQEAETLVAKIADHRETNEHFAARRRFRKL